MNISTAKKIAVFPEFDCGRLGMISHAHDALGAKMKFFWAKTVCNNRKLSSLSCELEKSNEDGCPNFGMTFLVERIF